MLVNVEIMCLAFYYLFDQDPDHRLILGLANLNYENLQITIYNGKLSFSYVFFIFFLSIIGPRNNIHYGFTQTQ